MKTESDEQARAATVLARERWEKFQGKRQVHVDKLMFVRETGGIWQDVAAASRTRPIIIESVRGFRARKPFRQNPLKPATGGPSHGPAVHVLSARC
jgi:hypothetical protein